MSLRTDATVTEINLAVSGHDSRSVNLASALFKNSSSMHSLCRVNSVDELAESSAVNGNADHCPFAASVSGD
ncbi:hypothetical protein TNCV_3854611 [Trichonephila clavipes]|nr:hypothetical protein TNCV_3854611 [Trichonephila clavipes]